jgi:hypothetical protein
MRWLAAWVLRLLGSVLAPLMRHTNFEWPYRGWNRLMLLSNAAQGEGPGPWKDPPGARDDPAR